MQVPETFEYERATSVEDALALLAKYGDEARLIAGGHSLLPMMKLRLAVPEVLSDIKDIAGLDHIRIDGDEIAIGAMVRHAAIKDSALLFEHYQVFHDAESVIADPLVRNRGTIGGSLCQADPAEDRGQRRGAVAYPGLLEPDHGGAPAAAGVVRAVGRGAATSARDGRCATTAGGVWTCGRPWPGHIAARAIRSTRSGVVSAPDLDGWWCCATSRGRWSPTPAPTWSSAFRGRWRPCRGVRVRDALDPVDP